MNLDALRDEWKSLDAKVDLGVRMSLAQLRRSLDARRRPSAWRAAPGLIVDGLVLCWLGSFGFDQRGSIGFVLPAVALFVWVALYAAATVRELVWWSELDFGAPLVEAQRRLAALRRARIRRTQAVFLSAGLLWALGIVVLAKALGFDLYTSSLRAWLIANLVFGVAIVPVLWGAMRWLAPWLDACGWLQPLRDDLAGKELVAIEAQLVELATFEHQA